MGLAQYEQAIEAPLRETPVAPAVAQAEDDRIGARRKEMGVRLNLSHERFRRRIDEYVSVLHAWRNADRSCHNLIGAGLYRALNVVALFRAPGGDQQVP